MPESTICMWDAGPTPLDWSDSECVEFQNRDDSILQSTKLRMYHGGAGGWGKGNGGRRVERGGVWGDDNPTQQNTKNVAWGEDLFADNVFYCVGAPL